MSVVQHRAAHGALLGGLSPREAHLGRKRPSGRIREESTGGHGRHAGCEGPGRGTAAASTSRPPVLRAQQRGSFSAWAPATARGRQRVWGPGGRVLAPPRSDADASAPSPPRRSNLSSPSITLPATPGDPRDTQRTAARGHRGRSVGRAQREARFLALCGFFFSFFLLNIWIVG